MFQFFYNAYAGCGADAGYAQLDHAQSGIQSADAAGRLDLYLVADAFFHQCHILKGCAAGAKARGRLYEIRADLPRDGTQCALFLLGQVAVLNLELQSYYEGVL